MAINPVELISASRKRLARNAAIRTSSYFLAPALTATALGALPPAIGAMTWQQMGYLVEPEVLSDARFALIALGFFALLVGAYRGWSDYRASDDLVGAAVQVDQRVHANEQVVTLATLSRPGVPETARSSLFPVLWRNVMTVLSAFDPEKEFTIQLGDPLKHSWLPTTVVIVACGLSMLAFIRLPTPLEKTATELRDLANKIDASATTPEDKQLAQKVKRVAISLASSNVPPEEKQKEIEAVLAEVEKKEANPGDHPTGTSTGTG